MKYSHPLKLPPRVTLFWVSWIPGGDMSKWKAWEVFTSIMRMGAKSNSLVNSCRSKLLLTHPSVLDRVLLTTSLKMWIPPLSEWRPWCSDSLRTSFSVPHMGFFTFGPTGLRDFSLLNLLQCDFLYLPFPHSTTCLITAVTAEQWPEQGHKKLHCWQSHFLICSFILPGLFPDGWLYCKAA